jgi:hypothetical protein
MGRTTTVLGAVLVLITASALGACSGAIDEVGSDDAALSEAGASGEIPIGTQLVTTSRVNFRRGPSTSARVIRVLEIGASVITINRTTPVGAFYNVQNGSDVGWVHGAYLARRSAGSSDAGGPAEGGTPATGCIERRLTFSADGFPSMPSAGSAYVWGANASGGESEPYSSDFIGLAQQAHQRGLQVFAYLEGPCGDTGGVDDGERARCQGIHNAFNQQYAPNTPNTAQARWKPFTMKQLTMSGQIGADYCEIDNLSNNVTIPLNPLLQEIKGMYESGQVHCRIVLKNIEADDIDAIRSQVAPTPAAANFIAPFHIYEADDTSQKSELDAAMVRLKGPGAETIISTDTNHYGSAFTNDRFLACN